MALSHNMLPFMLNIVVKIHLVITNSKRNNRQETFFSFTKKGTNSVKNGQSLPINNPTPLIPDNNIYAKFEKFS